MGSLDGFLAETNGKASIYNNMRLAAGTPLADKTYVIIPDTHLLEKGPTDDFYDPKNARKSLGKNSAFEDRFLDFLDFLMAKKTVLKDEFQIIQLGDMYDLWQARGNTNMIESRYTDILGLLDALDCVYVIGNHDIDLWNFKKNSGKFSRTWRHFSSSDLSKAKIMFEHGFQADFFNNQSKWSGAIGKIITEIVATMEYIEPDIDTLFEKLWDKVSRALSIYNAGLSPVNNREDFNNHEYIDYYINAVAKYRAGNTDDHRQTPKLECVVIGHTHKARLVTRKRDGENTYLMDCGSWVNGGNEFGIITGNEMAVCSWG
jgi:UDP-2,3-diacylglucosamine pyrophosphatase LpxH